jgi:hypothetical protein
MRREKALLFHGLYGHKTHRRALNPFESCFGISSIALPLLTNAYMRGAE